MTGDLWLYVADGLVLLGLVMLTAGVLGLWRMPGLFNRLHASGVLLWLGLMPLIGALFTRGDVAVAAKAALLALSLMLTTPAASHALAHARFIEERDPEEETGGPD